MKGPLREYSDPANQQFLREVESGYVPREMEEPGMGNVSINLVDKKVFFFGMSCFHFSIFVG